MSFDPIARGLSVVALAKATPITRAQISGVAFLPDTFMVSGFTAAGDLGAGAVYTSAGATSGSLMAVQNASGTWFRLATTNELNVGWFGAKGDGVADDSTAIQAAITYACSLGGGSNNAWVGGGAGVFFPATQPGAFYNLVAAGLSLTNGYVTLRGVGSRITYTGTTAIAAVIEVSGAYQSFRFEDLFITGNANSNYAIEIIGGTRYVLDNVQVTGASNGVHISKAVCPSTRSLRISAINNGLVFDGQWGCDSGSFINTMVEICGGIGINITNSARNVFLGGTSENNSTGIQLQNVIQAGSVPCSYNTFHNMDMEANSIADVLITGNACYTIIMNCGVASLCHIVSGDSNRLLTLSMGGSATLQIDSGATNTIVDGLISLGASTLIDNGVSTLKINPSNSVAYSTNSSAVNFNMTAADLYTTGAMKILDLTGAPSSELFCTPSNVSLIRIAVGQINWVLGQSYLLRIINHTSQLAAIFPVGGYGWTVTGTLTIPTLTYRDFFITIVSLTAMTMTTVGSGPA